MACKHCQFWHKSVDKWGACLQTLVFDQHVDYPNTTARAVGFTKDVKWHDLCYLETLESYHCNQFAPGKPVSETEIPDFPNNTTKVKHLVKTKPIERHK